MTNKEDEMSTINVSNISSSTTAYVPKGPKKVLIVEDSLVIQKTCKVFLNSVCRGCQVINAYNGQEAMSLLEDHKDVDMILLDLKMPIMGGLAFLEIAQCHQKYSHIPIVVITTRDMKAEIRQAVQRGAKGYIIKPISTSSLSTAIHKLFGS